MQEILKSFLLASLHTYIETTQDILIISFSNNQSFFMFENTRVLIFNMKNADKIFQKKSEKSSKMKIGSKS